MDPIFAPPGVAWQRVSPRLAVLRRLLVGLAALAVGAGGSVVLALLGVGSPLVFGWCAAVVVVAGWGLWFAGRVVARWGYAEQEAELAITRGALFRRLVVVPYGRMQYVDVQAGPLDQLLGIASVTLHTASPGTTAVIPGLPAAEAARLRDRLTAVGESQAAGL